MLERIWRKENPPIQLMGSAPLENSLEVPLKIRVIIWSSIPLLGIYPEKTLIWKDTCIPTFRAALIIIAKTCKQPKCTSTDEWVKVWVWVCGCVGGCGCVYTHNGILPIHKKEWNSTMCSNMYRPRDYHLLLLSEIRQKKTNTIFTDHITAMRNLKHDTNELIYKTETDSQTLKKTWLPKGRGRGRDKLGVWG